MSRTFDEITARRKFLFENFGMRLVDSRMVADPNIIENSEAAHEYNKLAEEHARFKP